MAQLDFRAKLDVAGEQAERRRLGQITQCADQLPDTGTNLRLAPRKDVIEPEDVALEELREMLRRFGESVDAKKFTDETDIGAAANFIFSVP